MKVKFVSDAIAVMEKGPETLFRSGDIQDLNPASAARWLRRGIAVEVTDAAAEAPAAAKKKGKKSADEASE